MKLKCTINNNEFNIVNGATFSEEYNETLDSGYIIIDGVSKQDFKPFDDVFIYDIGSQFKGYNSRKTEYIEIFTRTNSQGGYIEFDRFGLEQLEEKTITEQRLHLNYITSNGYYDNYCGFEYNEQVGKYYLWLVTNPSVKYELTNYDVNFVRWYYTPMFEEAYFDYFTFGVEADQIQKPTFYRHLLIDNFTEQRLNPEGTLYKYKLALFSETKKLERIQLPNVSITQPINIEERRSVAEYINQYIDLYSPTIKVATSGFTYIYLPKYVVDDSVNEIFSDVYCPNFSLDNPSLRSLLNQLFLVKDRIPYVKDDVIYAMNISTRTTQFSLSKINDITSSMSSDNFSTDLKRNYKEALSSSRTARMVEYMGFRNSESGLMTLSNMRLETKFPIYKINKIYMCYYKKAQIWTSATNPPSYTGNDKVFLCKQDITKLIKMAEEQQTLSKDWNEFTQNPPLTIEEMEQYKLCTLSYSIGSNIIDGWGTIYEYPTGWWGLTTATKSYIENIFTLVDKFTPYGIYSAGYLAKGLNENQFISINASVTYKMDNVVTPFPDNEVALKLKCFFFMVDYEAFYNGTIYTSKDNETRDDIVTNDNQSSSLTLLEKDGLFQKEKANRFGNKAYTYNAIYDDVSELQDLGSVDNSTDEDVIIYHREYSIFDNFVKANYFGTKDYVLKNYYTSVYAKHRPFNLLSYSQSTIRAENRKLYLMLSKDTSYYEKINSDYNVNPQFKLQSFSNPLAVLLSFVRPSLTPLAIERFSQPEKINYGYVEFGGDKYASDINVFTSGYSLCMNISMWDNTSMGNYISDLSPAMNSEATIDDLTGATQLAYMVVDNVETGMSRSMGFYFSHTPEETFDDIVKDYTPQFPSIAYTKLNDLPMLPQPEQENNIIGKEFEIFKDNKEVIDMTYQIELFTNNKDIIYSEWLMKLCDLYGTQNKFMSNVTIYDTTGVVHSLETDVGTIEWNRTLGQQYLYITHPLIILKIPVNIFSSLQTGQPFEFTYSWNVSKYDLHFLDHLPTDDVIVGLDMIASSIGNINSSEIYLQSQLVKWVRHGWWGGTSSEAYDESVRLIRVSRVGNIDFSNDPDNYYFTNILTTNNTNNRFTPVSLPRGEYGGDEDEYISYSTTALNNRNHYLKYSKVGVIGGVSKTYLKNYFVRFVNQEINKTLVYDEYAEGDLNFANVKVDDIVKIVEETNPNAFISESKTYLEFDISHYPQSTGLEIWYADRKDDGVADGTLHFVLGINFTEAEILNGVVRIYASLLTKKDIRVFGSNNQVVGEVTNYQEDDTFGYGERQYYVVK